MSHQGVILYADDHVFDQRTQEGQLYDLLRKEFPVMAVETVEMAEKAVNSVGTFSALILDWEFKLEAEEGVRRPPQTPEPFLENHDFYSLIYIFSRTNINPSLKKKFSRKFPGRVKFRTKSANDVNKDFEDIKSDLASWKTKNERSVVALDWSSTINSSVQKIFSELTRADVNWIHDLYKSADSDVSPEIEVVNLLQCILTEHLITDKNLLRSISKLKNDKSASITDKAKAVARLARKLYYTKLDSFSFDEVPIMTGDVFALNNSRTQYGVVVTPECDIRHIKGKSNEYFELLTFKRHSAKAIMKTTIKPNLSQLDKTAFYNSLGEIFGNELTKAQKISISRLINQHEKGQKTTQMRSLYKDALNQNHKRLHLLPSFYFTKHKVNELAIVDFRESSTKISGEEIESFDRICKINSPFIQELRQRYLAYIGRVGVPAPIESLKETNMNPLID